MAVRPRQRAGPGYSSSVSRIAGPGAALLALLLACSTAGTGTPPPAAAPIDWVARYGRDLPRVGSIRAVADGRWLDPPALFDALARDEFVLVGERHDDPDHHRLQAELVDALVARGRRPAVAFEMLDRDDAAPLAEALRTPGSPARRAEAIRAAVDWDAGGWPPFPLYAPVFEAALRADLPIVAANLPEHEVRLLARGGAAALPPAERARLGLDAPVAPAERSILMERIREAHCGHAPAGALDGMIAVQRAWNAQLARALVDAKPAGRRGKPAGADGAVEITGVEHVRTDVGVPHWLARFAPGARVASVALLEVDPREPDADPAAAWGDPPPFDYVWYTPRLDLVDPCARYREQLERM